MRTSIRTRLLGAFGLVVVLMLAIGLFAVDRLGRDNAQLTEMATSVMPGTTLVGEVDALLNKYRKDQLDYIVARPSDRPGAGGIDADLAGDLSAMRRLLASYQARGPVSDEVDRRLLDAFAADFARYVSITARFRAVADAGRLRAAGEVVADGAGDREYDRLTALSASWVAEKAGEADADAATGRAGYETSVVVILALLAAAVIAALAVAVAFAQRITGAVRAIGHAVTAISEGQIVPCVEVTSRDELGEMAQSFDGLLAYLSNTVAVTQAIAGGDLDIEVAPTGDHDALGHALAAMTLSLRAAQQDLRSSEETLRTVARLARGLPNHANPRQAICDAAREVARADIVQLWEPDGHAHLAATAAAGAELSRELRVPIDAETSGTAIAYHSRLRRVVFDVCARDAPVSARTRELLDAASTLYEPVIGHEETLGVLVVIWQTRVTEAQDRDIDAVGLLAAEAAVAIERAAMTARLTALARKDALTGLDNRRVWDEEYPRSLRRAGRSGQPICVAIADLDHFKAYNDTHGHPAGDRLLRDAATRWLSCLRDTDVLARYGGEEFAIVLPNAGLDDAVAVLQRLRAATPGGQTCSIGLAQWDTAETAEQLLARADASVYRAKAAGRDRIVSAADAIPDCRR